MEKQLSEFAFVLLDATFFTAPFPDDLAKQFADVNLYVPKTFYSELAQYRKLLPEGQRALYDKNFETVSHGTIRSVEIDKDKDKPFQSDTWGTVNVLSTMAKDRQVECLLITSDQLLIQRVILGDIPVGIYDLSGNVYVSVAEQEAWKAACEFQSVTGEDLVRSDEELPDELTLYKQGGERVFVVGTDMEGAEARIYMLPEDDSLVAKVFSGGRLKQKKIRNVRKLQEIGERISAPWVMFPKLELFWDPECTKHAGFLLSYEEYVTGLDQNPMYLGNLDDSQCDWNTRISATVNRCLQLVRQIALLNVYGMYLSDYNLANFAVHPKIPHHIIMWDVDSFCSRYYEPSSWDNSTQPAFLTNRQEKNNAEAIVNCTELLYICVFRMLTLGQRVFAPDQRRFLMTQVENKTRWKREIIPDNLWQLFQIVFRDNNRAAISVDALLHELTMAAEELRAHPELDLSYQQALEQSKQKPKRPARPVTANQTFGSDVALGLRMLPGQLGKRPWSGVGGEPNLMRAQLSYPLLGSALDAASHSVEVTPMHFRRCQIRPLVYQNKPQKKSGKKRRWLWMALMIFLLGGMLYFLFKSQYHLEHMKEWLLVAKQSLEWVLSRIMGWYRKIFSKSLHG